MPDQIENEPSWQIRITGLIVPWVEFDAAALRDCHEAFDPIDLPEMLTNLADLTSPS